MEGKAFEIYFWSNEKIFSELNRDCFFVNFEFKVSKVKFQNLSFEMVANIRR